MNRVPMLDSGSGRLRIEGATAVITGLVATEIIGFAGFGIDVENWVAKQTQYARHSGSGRLLGRLHPRDGQWSELDDAGQKRYCELRFVDGTGTIYAASQEVDYTGSASATRGWIVVERSRWAALEHSMRRCR
jgi:hypothetical protein